MQIEYQSDVGRRRNTNQDYASVFTNQEGIKLAILADGMGGHRAGDIASQMAVLNLGNAWEEQDLTDDEKIAQWFIQAIQEENALIYQRGQEQPEYNGMGTTIVAAALSEERFTIAHVGDSSVGMPGTVEVDVSTYIWQLKDRLLLCSDGLTNMLSEEMIETIVNQEGTLSDKVTELINQANEAGGADNITVLLIEFKEDAA